MRDAIRPTVEIDNSASTGEIIKDLLIGFRFYIFVFVVGLTTAVWLTKPQLPSLPVGAEVAALALLGAFGIGYIPVWKALDYIYNPPKRYIVVPGLKEDAEPGLWQLTPAAFSRLDVTGGDLYQWPGTKYPTYEVEEFYPDQMRAVATWRGSAPDSELIREQERIKSIRGKLEDKARERDVLEIRGKSLVRQAVMEERETFLKEYDRASLLEAEAYDEQLEELLEEADLEGQRMKQQRRKTDPQETDEGGKDTTTDKQVRTNGDGNHG